ncbi:MAG: CBS domain-containing protein, partial [Bacteroidota bacterium]
MKPIIEIVQERPLYTAGKDHTITEAAIYMAEKKIGAIPVVDGNKLVGIFSERDVITRVIAKGLDPARTKIADVMTTKIVVAEANDSYQSCLQKMQQAHCRHLP